MTWILTIVSKHLHINYANEIGREFSGLDTNPLFSFSQLLAILNVISGYSPEGDTFDSKQCLEVQISSCPGDEFIFSSLFV